VGLPEFRATYPFAFDDFQERACGALAAGRSVLVCAPTGAGKTVVGECAVWLALERGAKCFYTTPLKALSNQKFGDLIARHGAARVGLLTGDNAINGEAPIVVMTTEVLRNMLYEGSSTLDGLGFVVLDEVHYLKDPYRGAVWEEVLIHLPDDVQVVALSATVSNAEEFGAWLAEVRGDVEVVITDERPVPLEHFLLARDRLVPLFVTEDGERRPNPALRRLGAREPGRGRGRGGRARWRPPDRVEVVERLRDEGMLPAIVFIFSRAGCDQAVRQCLGGGLALTDPEERERILEYVELRAAVLPPDDHAVLGYDEWVEALARGVAAHHAGLIPLFKETVEELFERGLLKVAFATETLALGINMPAKTVVIERLVKFTGERHEMLTPADYTQLTGRAGRRGIDPVGYGVVLEQPDVPPAEVARLAGARTFPLVSSFRPSYNMAVNLLRRHSVEEATRLLNLSFAQFLADRAVTHAARQIERNERFLEGYRRRAACHLGDFAAYQALVRAARDAERATRRDATARRRADVAALRPGLVVNLRRGRLRGRAAVVDVRRSRAGTPQVVVVGAEGRAARLGERDFGLVPEVVGEIRLPRGDRRSRAFRAEVGRRLARLAGADGPPEPGPRGERSPDATARGPGPAPAAAEAWERVRAHPCHACPEREEHERWADRAEALERETEGLRRAVRRRTETLARTFERVLDVLRAFGYVEGERLTTKGERLARIYNESDLLVAEVLEAGVLEDLDVPDLAGIVSTFVYEARSAQARAAARSSPARGGRRRAAPGDDVAWPTERLRRAFGRVARAFARIREAERERGLELCREPDPGFVEQIWWWAKGEPLEEVLGMGELSAGDFVRAAKQAWDLLRQLVEVAPSDALAARCREAARAVHRGVVAYSGAL
jgi:ATP-dependent RNA helicase HelY